MKETSYWPTIPPSLTAVGPTPGDLLKEQASLLATQTHGVLYGDVTASSRAERITLDLFIVAPKLNDYSYRLLKVRYDPIRPFEKVDVVVPGSPRRKVTGVDAYTTTVADVLQSPQTASIIGQLLGLSERASDDPV